MTKLQALRFRLEKIVMTAMTAGRTVLEREITLRYTGQGDPSLKRRNGRLAGAPRWEQRAIGNRIEGRLFIPTSGGATIPLYAGVHERGAVIVPRKPRVLVVDPRTGKKRWKGGVLAWQDTKAGTSAVRGGAWHFARRVYLRPRPIWRTVRATKMEAARRAVEKAMHRGVASLNRERFDGIGGP